MPATDAPVTIEEAIEAVNAATGGDKAKVRDFVKKLRSDSPDVANYLITSGKNQRDGEVQGDLKKLTDRIAELEGELETSHSELTTLRSKTPDVAAVEESAKRKYEKHLRKAEQDRDEPRASAVCEATRGSRASQAIRAGSERSRGQADRRGDGIRRRYAGCQGRGTREGFPRLHPPGIHRLERRQRRRSAERHRRKRSRARTQDARTNHPSETEQPGFLGNLGGSQSAFRRLSPRLRTTN